MKAIKLTKGLILKESQRLVNREYNTMEIRLQVKVLFGTVVTEELAECEKEVCIVINEELNSSTWAMFKDISISDLMSFIVENIEFELIPTDIKTLVSEATFNENGDEIKPAEYNIVPSNIESDKFKLIEPFYISLFPLINCYNNLELIEI